MSTYSPDGIGALIYKNGKWGPGGDKTKIVAFLDVAIAIALSESSGNDQAMHKNSDGSTDYGLWQINSVHKDLLKKYTWNNAGDNTEMARQIWEGAGKSFSPWSKYKSGAYKKNLGHGAQAYDKLANMKDPSSLSDLLKPSTWVEGIGDTVGQAKSDLVDAPFKVAKGILDSVFQFIKEGLLVVGVFILGVGLLILGTILLMSRTKAGSAALDAVPVARVAKLAKGVGEAAKVSKARKAMSKVPTGVPE